MAFSGLDTTAFATFEPSKWSSNVHNLARMKVKDVMVALCDQAAASLSNELDGLSRAASDEIPNITNQKKVDAQWIYWYRNKAERESLSSFLKTTPLDQGTIFNIATQDKHAILAVALREQEIWIGLRLATGAVVDRRNLASKMEKSWMREKLLESLNELPDGAVCTIDNSTVDVSELTLETLTELGHKLSKDDPTWWVGHRIDVDEAIALSTDLADNVGRWLGALAPLYRFVAWTRDNDDIEVNKQIQEEKAQKRRQATSYREGDKVRVISGLFSGKVGVVESVDTKAQVKVRIGLMSVTVSGAELTPAAR